jgi:hypothetical protein
MNIIPVKKNTLGELSDESPVNISVSSEPITCRILFQEQNIEQPVIQKNYGKKPIMI